MNASIPRSHTRFAALFLVVIAARGGWGADLIIERSIIAQGDVDWDWTQARTAVVPSPDRLCLTTMSRTAKLGSHGYHDVFVALSDNNARSWAEPFAIPSLKRKRLANGFDVVAGDLFPIWHPATGKVLITGKTFNFAEGIEEDFLREQVAYCVFDPNAREFGPLQTMMMPESDHEGRSFIAPNAGCHQQEVLPNGDVLIPIRYQKRDTKRIYTSIVARCRFDGQTLEYLEHGSEHSIPTGRGLYEPSVTEHGGEFFLTLRADDGAYVAKSKDGVHFGSHVAWKFDDGQSLGSYNTQQHWLTLGKRLYLVYTRRGAGNDHILRHRAPLFIAQVDTDNLNVIRGTEQVVVPEDHATLGNSGVCRISDQEAWVTVAEGRVSYGKREGENNRVFLARLRVRE